MIIGKLKHRISLLEFAKIPDGMGGYAERWQDIDNFIDGSNQVTPEGESAFRGSVWAAIEPVLAREMFQAQQIQSEITHKITIRYRSGVSPKMRVRFKERFFDISTIINFREENSELQLMCKEVMK